jgi:hypothetical protein
VATPDFVDKHPDTVSKDAFSKALAAVGVNPGFPSETRSYIQKQAEVLLREKKIKEIPDW